MGIRQCQLWRAGFEICSVPSCPEKTVATSPPQPWLPRLKGGVLGGRRGENALSVVQALCKLSACGNSGFLPFKKNHNSFYGSPESTFISFFRNPKLTSSPSCWVAPGPSLHGTLLPRWCGAAQVAPEASLPMMRGPGSPRRALKGSQCGEGSRTLSPGEGLPALAAGTSSLPKQLPILCQKLPVPGPSSAARGPVPAPAQTPGVTAQPHRWA